MASLSDALNLQTFEKSKASNDLSGNVLDNTQDQIRDSENEILKAKVTSLQNELQQVHLQASRDREQHSAGVSGDKIAKKIVDLSKRNRELGAEVIRHKQTIRDLQSKIREYEEKSKALSSSSVEIASLSEDVHHNEHDARQSKLMNDVSSLKAKLSSARKQVESLKQEVAIAHKVLAKEVGDGFTVSELLAGVPGWRGRAQQITVLQNKISELKKQLKAVDGKADEYSSSGDLVKQKVRLKQLEQKRKNELEDKAVELEELKVKHMELLQQMTALKARNHTLSSQVKSNAKASHSAKSRLQSRELQPCPNCTSTKAVGERELARKDKEIHSLRQELKLYKTKPKLQLGESRVRSAPGLPVPHPVSSLDGPKLSMPESLDVAEWSTRARIAEVEKDKLLEMISLLHQRLDEAVSRLAEVPNRKSKVSGHTLASTTSGSESELLERIQIQLDENQALKETLSHYQTSKAQDIRLLTELFKQSRLQFSQTIKEIKTKLSM